MPCHAMPCHAMPCHAMPCHAMPCHAKPSQAKPSQAKPSQAKPSQAKPSKARPSLFFQLGRGTLGWETCNCCKDLPREQPVVRVHVVPLLDLVGPVRLLLIQPQPENRGKSLIPSNFDEFYSTLSVLLFVCLKK
jgi:hypothetical protein